MDGYPLYEKGPRGVPGPGGVLTDWETTAEAGRREVGVLLSKCRDIGRGV